MTDLFFAEAMPLAVTPPPVVERALVRRRRAGVSQLSSTAVTRQLVRAIHDLRRQDEPTNATLLHVMVQAVLRPSPHAAIVGDVLMDARAEGMWNDDLAEIVFRALANIRTLPASEMTTTTTTTLDRQLLDATVVSLTPSLRAAAQFLMLTRLSSVMRSRMPMSTVVNEQQQQRAIRGFYHLERHVQQAVMRATTVDEPLQRARDWAHKLYLSDTRLVHAHLQTMLPAQLHAVRDGALLFMNTYFASVTTTTTTTNLAADVFEFLWQRSGWRDVVLRALLWTTCGVDRAAYWLRRSSSSDASLRRSEWLRFLQLYDDDDQLTMEDRGEPRIAFAVRGVRAANATRAVAVLQFCVPLWLMQIAFFDDDDDDDDAAQHYEAAYDAAWQAVQVHVERTQVVTQLSWHESILVFWQRFVTTWGMRHGLSLALPDAPPTSFKDLHVLYDDLRF